MYIDLASDSLRSASNCAADGGADEVAEAEAEESPPMPAALLFVFKRSGLVYVF